MLDAFVLICAVGGIGFGVSKGFAIQVAGILGLILGFTLASPISKGIVRAAELSSGQGLAIYFAVFSVISLICYGIAIFFRKKLEEKKLGDWDKKMGGVIGLFHGLFMSIVLTFGMLVMAPSTADKIRDSASAKPMGTAFWAIHEILPEEIQDAMDPLIERAKSEQGAKGAIKRITGK